MVHCFREEEEKTRCAHKSLFIYESPFCLSMILMDSQVSKSCFKAAILNTVTRIVSCRYFKKHLIVFKIIIPIHFNILSLDSNSTEDESAEPQVSMEMKEQFMPPRGKQSTVNPPVRTH